MAQQRNQFDTDIRAAYKSPLRKAVEAVEEKLVALGDVMDVSSSQSPVKKSRTY